MTACIRTIEGVGKATLEVFETAGFRTVYDLQQFNMEDDKLWTAVSVLQQRYGFDSHHWKGMVTRCLNIIYRARSAEATDFVPEDYMCPISLDWFRDPVVAPSGH